MTESLEDIALAFKASRNHYGHKKPPLGQRAVDFALRAVLAHPNMTNADLAVALDMHPSVVGRARRTMGTRRVPKTAAARHMMHGLAIQLMSYAHACEQTNPAEVDPFASTEDLQLIAESWDTIRRFIKKAECQ